MASVYVPILKGKEGELSALEELSTAVSELILPLIEVPPVPYDFVNERPTKTLDAHVAAVVERLHVWKERPLYVDLPSFGDTEHLDDGTVAVRRVLDDCRTVDIDCIPVVSSSSTGAYLAGVRDHLQGRGAICIRLTDADFDEEGNTEPKAEVERLLRAAGLRDFGAADLILDLQNIPQDLGRATLLARAIIGEAPHLDEWRRVVVSAASFPENLSDVSASAVTNLPRTEWDLWRRLKKRGMARADIVFGDYGITHPTLTELDPRTMRMSASIRYTTLQHWLILKGKNVRQYGFDQYFDLCRTLVELPDYSGEGFSWGDGFIARCARGATGPGNATTWRKVGTNHHLTLVARDLAGGDA